MDEIQPQHLSHKENLPRLSKRSRAGGPVTCISYTSEENGDDSSSTTVFWGLGSYLYRIRKEERESMGVFPQDVGGSVHGIAHLDPVSPRSENSWDSLVFGGKQIAFCRIQESPMRRMDIEIESKPSTILTTTDWIWDVHAIPQTNTEDDTVNVTVIVGLAMHKIDIFSAVSTKATTPCTVSVAYQHRIDGSPSCLVTSMNMLQQNDTMWIASGTAFKEIRIWSFNVQTDQSSSLKASSNDYTLQGHAGIIHCVQFSDSGKALVSTADDRSVRLWGYDDEKDRWGQSWVGWGHSARVWSAGFGPETVVSVAEDCQAKIWSFQTGEELAFIQHPCTLWKVVVVDDMAIVGATDGTISLHNLSTKLAGRNLEVLASIEIPDDRPKITPLPPPLVIDGEPNPKKSKGAKKIVSQVLVGMQWVDCSRLLVATREGSLLLLDTQTKNWMETTHWCSSSESVSVDPKTGCCMSLFEEQVAIGTTKGDVIVHSTFQSNTRESIVCSARSLKAVRGLQWLNETTLASFHVNSVAIWEIEPGRSMKDILEPRYILKLETKGIPSCCAMPDRLGKVVVGDTRGNLSLFDLQNGGDDGKTTMAACSILARAHQKMHVTKILMTGNRVVSAGNDGFLYVSFVEGLTILKGWSLPVPSMTGITEIWMPNEASLPISTQSSTCFAAGYFGNIFRVINITTGHEFFRIDTGGRQQTSAFSCTPDASGFPNLCRIAICKAQKEGTNTLLIQGENSIPNQPLIQEGPSIHGETIFDLCFFQFGIGPQPATLLLTGSEDCGSKICLCTESNIIDTMALTPQSSSIRSVCTSQCHQSSTLLVVGGSKLTLQFFVVENRPSSEERATSLKDLAVTYLGQGINRRNVSIDHRVNAVCANALEPDNNSEREHVVVAGDSDGYCHLSFVNENEEQNRIPGLMLESGGRPILCVETVRVDNRLLVAMGSTAGDVQLYHLPALKDTLKKEWKSLVNTWKPFAVLKGVHQMGINCLSISTPLKISDSTFRVSIWTGGDDQGLVETSQTLTVMPSSLQVDGKEIFSRESGASFSAIKGLEQVQENCILTAGYTQRLGLWRRDTGISNGDCPMQILHNLPIDVGDVNCLAAMKTTTNGSTTTLVAAGGLGIELFSVQ